MRDFCECKTEHVNSLQDLEHICLFICLVRASRERGVRILDLFLYLIKSGRMKGGFQAMYLWIFAKFIFLFISCLAICDAFDIPPFNLLFLKIDLIFHSSHLRASSCDFVGAKGCQDLCEIIWSYQCSINGLVINLSVKYLFHIQ